MDLQLVVALNVMAISAIALLLALKHRPPGYLPWAIANAFVIAAGALALTFAEAWTLVAVASVFVPLIAVPATLSSLAVKAAKAGRADRAETLASWASVFHPNSQNAFNAALMQATASPRTVDNLAALQALEANASPAERAVLRAVEAAERQDWQAVIDATNMPAADAFTLKPHAIRAYGELGRYDEMIATYEAIKMRLLGEHLSSSQLFVFAFCGRPARVADLLRGALSHLEPETKAYWISIARLRADPSDEGARRMLGDVAQHGRREKSRVAATRQLGAAALPELSAAARALLDAADARMVREQTRRLRHPQQLYATLLLVAANLLGFALSEWQGGSENLDVLVTLGALWPANVVREGEWWRLLTAAFLHYGPVHLAVNMLMLYVLGRLIESTYGTWRMAAAYLWCAIASTGAVCWLMWTRVVDPAILMGASGAIFGLLGIETATNLVTWLRSRDALDRGRLSSVAMILGIQMVVDFTIPNISFLAHASGFAAGVIAGLVLVLSAPRVKPPVAQTA